MMEKRIFTIQGMHCAACAAAIERAVKKLPGSEEAYVNFAASELSFAGSDSDEDVIKAVAKAGFSGERFVKQTSPQKDAAVQKEESAEKKELYKLLTAWISGLLLILCHHLFTSPLAEMLLLLPVLYAGGKFFTGGIPALFRGAPDMNSLIAVGVLSGLIYSLICFFFFPGKPLFFDAGAMILMLVMLGKFLEARSKRKAAGAVRSLAALAPESALELLNDGSERKISVDDVMPGMKFKVLPGTKIPADGKVLSGNSSCDESMFTGESLPAEKHPGSSVFGGSINNEGVLIIEGESRCDDSMLSRIIATVRQAQGSRAPIARIADRVAGFFVWAVLGIAAVTLVLHLLLGSPFASALNHALGVLVIACPCSLGLATPIALICGIGKGASSGILIKNGAVMEEMAKIKAVVFDKTGTLTTGDFSITDILVLEEKWNSDRVLAIAAGLEKNVTHPLGKAVVEEAAKRMIEAPEISEIENIPGYGIKGVFAGKKFEICRDDDKNISAKGKSSMVLKEYGTTVGKILLNDTLREEAPETVKALQKMGLHVEMLTGDNPGAAASVAEKLALDGYHAGLMPADKSAIIKRLKALYGSVAMVGDGINDAPALAASDAGIAVGSGSAAAIEAAEVVLISNNLKNVPAAFELSRRTMRIIKQNLFWAFAYNMIGIPLAAGVFGAFLSFANVSPVFCAAAMGASSVTVVLNALRLRVQNFSTAAPNLR
ncbi:MAG: cadmium-translocating P-type ATPase [Lentisphaeria bacterium]|nr:cadmium-translocating P-type ATPase [Lentisphaeria bacterium]